MRIIHNAAFSTEERQLFKVALGSNIIQGLRHMIMAAETEEKLAISKKARASCVYLRRFFRSCGHRFALLRPGANILCNFTDQSPS